MKRGLLLAVLLAITGCRDASRWVRKLGFQPVNPPSNLLAPGAIVMRKHGFGEVRLLCTAEESLGANFKAPQSRTIGGRFARGRQVGWRLSGDALKQVKIAAANDTVESVHIKVSQARIENLTDTDVLLAVGKRSAACAAAMTRRKALGWELSLITRCLRADVSYGIQFKNEGKIDAEAKLANLQAVNVALGGTFSSTSDSTAAASDLIWGAADDVALAKIGSQDADVQALRGQSPVPSKRQSIFLPEETLIAPTADKSTQAPDDADDTPAWGITTDDAAAEPVPEMDDAMQDASEEVETGITSDGGFVPSGSQTAPSNDQVAAPVSPRSARRRD